MDRAPERGQMAPLLAAVIALAAALVLIVADLGLAAVERARARTAADAAALAGAAEGEAAARRAAGTNSAELVAFTTDGHRVEVEVTLGRARARATAEAVRATPAGVAPALAAALARAAQLLGRPVPVVAVTAGGAAVEVDPSVAAELEALSADSGLCRQGGASGPVHFAPCRPSSPG